MDFVLEKNVHVNMVSVRINVKESRWTVSMWF